jgi:hypothetical protein
MTHFDGVIGRFVVGFVGIVAGTVGDAVSEFTGLFGWAETLGLSPNGLGPESRTLSKLSEDPPISTNVQHSRNELRLSTNFVDKQHHGAVSILAHFCYSRIIMRN